MIHETFDKKSSSVQNYLSKHWKHKKGSKNLTENYRQISLTCIVCKIATINYDLSCNWGKHVSYIVNKAKKVLGIIGRSLGNDNRYAFSCLFKSLVRPILKYAVPVWSPLPKKGYRILGESPKKGISVGVKAKTRRNEL